MINDIFEDKFCLNLDKRSDRWTKVVNEFNSVGFKVNRVAAVDGLLLKDKNPELAKHFNPEELGIWPKIGLMKSWENLIDAAIDSNLKNITVFEDDLKFCENFKERYDTLLNNLPEKWDIIFFANNRVAPTGYSPPQNDSTFLDAKHSIVMGLHFVSVNASVLPRFKKYLKNGINIMRILNDSYGFTRYYSRSSLAQQIAGYSDIRQANLEAHQI